ncbi:MAG: OmpH family outer membrane protein [Bacteroidia bacterium]
MNQRLFIITGLFLLYCGTVAGQHTIGYVNLEAVLSVMPETKSMNQQLQSYQQKLGQSLKTKDDYFQLKLQEYQEKGAAGASEEELKPDEDELRRLQTELQKLQADSEQKLIQKQQDLMAPILEKIEKFIKEIAEAKKLDYILNSATNGNSVLLQAPDKDNITKDLLDKLGIKLPEVTDGNK